MPQIKFSTVPKSGSSILSIVKSTPDSQLPKLATMIGAPNATRVVVVSWLEKRKIESFNGLSNANAHPIEQEVAAQEVAEFEQCFGRYPSATDVVCTSQCGYARHCWETFEKSLVAIRNGGKSLTEAKESLTLKERKKIMAPPKKPTAAEPEPEEVIEEEPVVEEEAAAEEEAVEEVAEEEAATEEVAEEEAPAEEEAVAEEVAEEEAAVAEEEAPAEEEAVAEEVAEEEAVAEEVAEEEAVEEEPPPPPKKAPAKAPAKPAPAPAKAAAAKAPVKAAPPAKAAPAKAAAAAAPKAAPAKAAPPTKAPAKAAPASSATAALKPKPKAFAPFGEDVQIKVLVSKNKLTKVEYNAEGDVVSGDPAYNLVNEVIAKSSGAEEARITQQDFLDALKAVFTLPDDRAEQEAAVKGVAVELKDKGIIKIVRVK